MPTPKDLLQSAIEGDAIGFSEMYKEIMDEKSAALIEQYSITVAKNVYGEPISEDIDEEEDEDIVESEESEDLEEDIDEDDEDLEDLDLDLDDLDLDLEEDLDDEDA